MKSPAELTDIFRAQGLKVTPQRQLIFRVLDGAQTHPSAEAVHARVTAEMPTVSLRTVYQTLNDLVAMGELDQLDLGTGSARFDPNLTPHHHLVCSRCARVVDVDVDFPGVEVPTTDAHGFEVTRTEIVFRGLCEQCRSAAGETRTSASSTTPTTNQENHPHHG